MASSLFKDIPALGRHGLGQWRRRRTVLTGAGFSTRRSAASSVRSVSPSAMAASALLAAASTRVGRLADEDARGGLVQRRVRMARPHALADARATALSAA